jgi:hypothetical protein
MSATNQPEMQAAIMENYSPGVVELRQYKWRCPVCGMLSKEQGFCDHSVADKIADETKAENEAEWNALRMS